MSDREFRMRSCGVLCVGSKVLEDKQSEHLWMISVELSGVMATV